MSEFVKVKRLGFFGTRTANFERTAGFFRDVLGLEAHFAEPGWSVFRLPSGRQDFVEVYGPEKQDPRLFPTSTDGALVAFIVDDIVSARAEVAAAGIELIGELVWAAEVFSNPAFKGFGWFFLRAPDGNTYAIQQVPD